jgi:hypothetical protein
MHHSKSRSSEGAVQGFEAIATAEPGKKSAWLDHLKIGD